MPDQAETIARASQILLEWYRQHGRRHLPWRQPGVTPYHVWVSEIMLQQTQVSRVIPYYERLVARYPTVQNLAAASWEGFLPYYQGLGYYSRGRNMLVTARRVVEEYGGAFPRTLSELRQLPGIGPYTAAAILSFGYNQPHLAFDTNQQRVWGRVLYGSKLATVDPAAIETALPTTTNFRDLNAAVMDFANDICTNRSPQCATPNCPLREICVFAQTGGALEPATSLRKSTFPAKEAQTVLVLHRQHQEYFSPNPQRYQPFILPPPLNTRARIKEYFQRTYGLNLSVRPPHWRGTWQDVPTQIVNAQILAGEHSFTSFPPSDHTHVIGQITQLEV